MRFEPHLAKRDANFRPLSPVDFLVRAAEVHADRTAIVWNDRRWTYRQFSAMAERLRARLAAEGVGPGDVVSVISPNRPELLAAHYAIPALGAVLNAINLRLDADTVAYILAHAESRVLIADPGSMELARAAAVQAGVDVLPLGDAVEGALPPLDLLSADGGDAPLRVTGIDDEWQPLALNYTSGTTGRPKGVVYTHRGAYLNALGNVLALGFNRASVYLWTLPMFHCNGWCHTWAVTAAGATHVCLERPDPPLIFRAMEQQGITHFACAPVVLYMLLNHPDRPVRPVGPRVLVGTGGAAPTSALIAQLDAVGIDIIHLYGLTKSYGPLTLCALPEELEGAPADVRAGYLARQGSRHVTASDVGVVDDAGADVPADGATLGEIRLRGNTVMAGYYRDAGRDRGRLRRRLAEDGRPRGARSRRGGRDPGPIQGHHHLRRGEHLEHRDRERPPPAPGGSHGRRRGCAAPEMGRGALRLHRTQGGAVGRGRRAPRLLPQQAARLQAAEAVRLPRTAQDRHRQGAEIRAPRGGGAARRDRLRRPQPGRGQVSAGGTK